MNSTNFAGANLVFGLPADNLYSALLWYVVYKSIQRAVVGVGVALAERRLLAGLQASAAATAVAEHISYIEILEARVGRPEAVERVTGSHGAHGVLRTVKHHCKADYALHTEKIWRGTTCAGDV